MLPEPSNYTVGREFVQTSRYRSHADFLTALNFLEPEEHLSVIEGLRGSESLAQLQDFYATNFGVRGDPTDLFIDLVTANCVVERKLCYRLNAHFPGLKFYPNRLGTLYPIPGGEHPRTAYLDNSLKSVGDGRVIQDVTKLLAQHVLFSGVDSSAWGKPTLRFIGNLYGFAFAHATIPQESRTVKLHKYARALIGERHSEVSDDGLHGYTYVDDRHVRLDYEKLEMERQQRLEELKRITQGVDSNRSLAQLLCLGGLLNAFLREGNAPKLASSRFNAEIVARMQQTATESGYWDNRQLLDLTELKLIVTNAKLGDCA